MEIGTISSYGVLLKIILLDVPASGNPHPSCTKPRTRVTNIKEYYFCNVRAVRHQFYLIYCLFISYANVNNYVPLFF
jgi:hypothetical protein